MGRLILWLVLLLFVMPFCGFSAGMAVPNVIPPLGNLAAPLACSNGTLQAQPSSASTSYSVVFRTRFWCVDSATAVRNDVSTPVLYISGVIYAAVAIVLLLIFIGVFETTRFLRSR